MPKDHNSGGKHRILPQIPSHLQRPRTVSDARLATTTAQEERYRIQTEEISALQQDNETLKKALIESQMALKKSELENSNKLKKIIQLQKVIPELQEMLHNANESDAVSAMEIKHILRRTLRENDNMEYIAQTLPSLLSRLHEYLMYLQRSFNLGVEALVITTIRLKQLVEEYRERFLHDIQIEYPRSNAGASLLDSHTTEIWPQLQYTDEFGRYFNSISFMHLNVVNSCRVNNYPALRSLHDDFKVFNAIHDRNTFPSGFIGSLDDIESKLEMLLPPPT